MKKREKIKEKYENTRIYNRFNMSIYLLYINITRNVNTRVANWLRWHVFEKRISGDASPHLSHAHATRLSSATLCLIVPTHIPNT